MGTRKPNLLWDALVKEYYPKGLPKSQRKALGRCVADLKEQGGMPEQIRIRRRRLVTLWGAQADTVFSLVKHWQKLDHEPPAPVVGKVKQSSKKGWGE